MLSPTQRQRIPGLWQLDTVSETAWIATHAETKKTLAVIATSAHTYDVTSSSGGQYSVDTSAGYCGCPDFTERAVAEGRCCLHLACCHRVRQARELEAAERDLAALEARRAETTRKLEHLHRLMAA